MLLKKTALATVVALTLAACGSSGGSGNNHQRDAANIAIQPEQAGSDLVQIQNKLKNAEKEK